MAIRPDRELYETLRERVRLAGLGNGPWQGQEADDVVETVAKIADSELAKEVARIVPEEAIRWGATWVAESQDTRYEARTGPDGATIPGVMRAYRGTEEALAARLVLEHAMRNRASGSHQPDARHSAKLRLLADQTWKLYVAADRINYGITKSQQLSLERSGRFDIRVADAPPFRISRFVKAHLDRMRSHPEESEDLALANELKGALEKGTGPPSQLEEIDAALEEVRGHSLLELFVALVALAEMAGGNDTSVSGLALPRDYLAGFTEHVELRFPQYDPRRVANVLPHLTWSQELLQESPTNVADYREVPARLISRPLVELPSGGFFVARTVPFQASLVYLLRITEGTWVEELKDVDRPLAKALEQRRRSVRPIDGFERALADRLATIGLPHATSIRQNKRGSVSKIGVAVGQEVDAVVVDSGGSVIWVIEAKDFAIPFSARRIRSELDKYFRPGGHRDKLTAKCRDIQSDTGEVVSRLGAPAGAYEVKGLFVTREPTPASCHDDRRHTFTLLDELENAMHH